jgi:hypothetical protein
LRFSQRFDDAETGELIHPACEPPLQSDLVPGPSESTRVQQRSLPFTEKVSTYMN